MKRRKHAICYIDDDPDEVRRFAENLRQYFIIGAGASLKEAMAELRAAGCRKPALFVLDLFFVEGAATTGEQHEKLYMARENFLKAQASYRSVLAGLEQSRQGGLELAQKVRQHFGPCGYIFSRARPRSTMASARLKLAR